MKKTIVKNNKKEKEFINDLKNRISCINVTNILNCKMLEYNSGIHFYCRRTLV